jgi:hypothetical protein
MNNQNKINLDKGTQNTNQSNPFLNNNGFGHNPNNIRPKVQTNPSIRFLAVIVYLVIWTMLLINVINGISYKKQF